MSNKLITQEVINEDAITFYKASLGDENQHETAAKIKIAKELGLPVSSAIMGIYFMNIGGKRTMSWNYSLIAACLQKYKDGEKYRYRIIENTKERTQIDFYEKEISKKMYQQPNGEWIQGVEEEWVLIWSEVWTIERAKSYGYFKKPMWTKMPETMLISKAISNGVRIVCPVVTNGNAYTPDELDSDIEVDQDGYVVDVSVPKMPDIIDFRGFLRWAKEEGYEDSQRIKDIFKEAGYTGFNYKELETMQELLLSNPTDQELEIEDGIIVE